MVVRLARRSQQLCALSGSVSVVAVLLKTFPDGSFFGFPAFGLPTSNLDISCNVVVAIMQLQPCLLFSVAGKGSHAAPAMFRIPVPFPSQPCPTTAVLGYPYGTHPKFSSQFSFNLKFSRRGSRIPDRSRLTRGWLP